jgi:hypothetical protein
MHGRVDAALVSAQIAQICRHRRRRLTRPAIAPIGGNVRSVVQSIGHAL